jgi:hypothetical protein
MSRGLSSLVTVGILAAALVLPAGVTAAPASTTFAISGYEYAFTQTVGSFAGTGTGNAGDSIVWNATVEHDPLGTMPTTYVNGGYFQIVSRSPAWIPDVVLGSVIYHSGTITTLDSGPGCTDQRYLVTGALNDVTTTTTTGGTGTFRVTLTHYRVSFFGRCLIYNARVTGTVSIVY